MCEDSVIISTHVGALCALKSLTNVTVSEVFRLFKHRLPTTPIVNIRLAITYSLFAMFDRTILTLRLAYKLQWRSGYRLVTDALLLTERTMYRGGSTGWRSLKTPQPKN